MDSVRRTLLEAIRVSLTDSPVVFVQGSRQTGKSTLVQSLTNDDGSPRRYLTLDDSPVYAAATSDPDGFLAGLDGPVTIDEVQRAPALAVAIKAAVDRRRTAGRFLLTGSAHFMVLPKLSESLAGRMEIHTLWPFSQGELTNTRETFLDDVFADRFTPPQTAEALTAPDLVVRLLAGGYPEIRRRPDGPRRRAWFHSYIDAILYRDIREISNVRDMADMPRLLSMLASRAAGLLDYTDLARSLQMSASTVKRYLALLEATFLIHQLLPWHTNLGKRLVKTPKVLMNDTGLLLHLAGADAPRLRRDTVLYGAAFENFVAMELLKQRGWSDVRPEVLHFRAHNGNEVDIVLEDAAGRIVGVEVKATATVTANHFKGLRALAALAGDRFVRGIVLNLNPTTVPFAHNLLAMPVSGIWAAR